MQRRNALGVSRSSGAALRTTHPSPDGDSLATRPRVSLVIVATGGGAQADLALEAALPACRDLQVELLLVRPGDPVSLHRLPDGARLVPAGPEVSPDGYRSLGLESATGDVVVLTTDLEAVSRDWQSILLHRLGLVAESGGAASQATGSTAASHGNPVA